MTGSGAGFACPKSTSDVLMFPCIGSALAVQAQCTTAGLGISRDP
jgi:hypothetical protein